MNKKFIIIIICCFILIYNIQIVSAHTFIGNSAYKDTTNLVETFFGKTLPELEIYNEPNYNMYSQRIKEKFGEEYIKLAATSWGVTNINSNIIIINCEYGCDYEYVLTHELVHRYQFLKGPEYCKDINKLEYKAEVIANIILKRKYRYDKKIINELFIADIQ